MGLRPKMRTKKKWWLGGMGLNWLLSFRQDDGGWAIPIRIRKMDLGTGLGQKKAVQPDRTKPFSHLITGIVLRAFAAHPQYRRRQEVIKAGELLISRFFTSDKYTDLRTPAYWTKFSYPFFCPDILSSTDLWLSLAICRVLMAYYGRS